MNAASDAKVALCRDHTGVEPEDMHASEVACMFDLDAAIDDDLHATRFGDGYAFRRNHVVLKPQELRADRHGLPGNVRNGGGFTKDVNEINASGYRRDIRITLAAKDRGLAWIDRYNLITVPCQVITNKMTGAQRIG